MTQLDPIYVDDQPDTLQTVPQEETPVSIKTDTGAPDGLPYATLPKPTAGPVQPSEKTVTDRTFKSVYGDLPTLINKSPDEIKAAISAGQEDWIRKEVAAKIDFKNAEMRHKRVIELANTLGRPLNPEDLVPPPLTDPDKVLEKIYSTAYIGSMDKAASFNPENFIDKSKAEIPEQLGDTQSKSITLAEQREFISTIAQNLEDKLKIQEDQAPGLWTTDQLKLMFQPYSEIKLRGLLKEVGALDGGVLLGTNVESTVDNILNLPGDKFKETVTSLISTMERENPTLAAMFAQTLLGSTTSDRRLNNLFTLLAPLDVLGVVGATKSLLTKVGLVNDIRTGYRGMVKALEIPKPTKAIIEEAAGDVKQAAVSKVADEVLKTNAGEYNPTQTAVDRLMSGFKESAGALSQNPGSFVREAVTRLQDNMVRGGETLLQAAVEKSKVLRTPLALSVEENLKAIQDKIVSSYRGPKNTLLDIGDPIVNEVTGTHDFPARIGNFGNTLFSSEELAQNFGRDILKESEVRVRKAEGNVEITPPGSTGSKTDLNNKARLEKSIPKMKEQLKIEQGRINDTKLNMTIRKEASENFKFISKSIRKYEQQLKEIDTRATPTAAVVQKGVGFYIEKIYPFNENDWLVKDLMIKDKAGNLVPDAVGTSSASGFESIRNGVFGLFRGANHTLSKNEMMQRNAATFGTTGLRKWAQEEGKALVDLAKGRVTHDEITGEPIPWYRMSPRPITGELKPGEALEQFTRTLKHAQDAEDPITKQPGYFFKQLGELEHHYLTYYQRPPSFNEASAYFTFVKLVEAERTLMEISEFKYRHRVGAEQHQFWFTDEFGNKVNSGFIDGVDRKELPGGSENMLILGNNKGDEQLVKTNALSQRDRDLYKDEVAQGQSKVIQIYATGHRPLAGFSDVAGNERVVYVLARNVETKPLDYNHVVRRGGGHFDFDYDHYIKQPIITPSRRGDEHLYEGDRTFMPVDNRAMGKDIARKMNEVVALMEEKKMDAAKEKFLANKLPMEWDRFKGFFEVRKGEDGKTILPRYSTKERFEVVQKGHQIADTPSGKRFELEYKGYRDGTKSGDLSKQFQVEYNRERDSERVFTFNDKGSPGRPDYEYQPANMVDPIASFSRSFNRMINSTFMDDYKIYTVEHWLREASDYLKPKESELRSAPFAHFNTPEWKSGVDLLTKSNLLSNRFKAKQFIGMPNKFDTSMFSLQQLVADSVWSEANPFKRGALLIPHWLLPYHKEPVAAIRSLAYHFKLGLYALPQIATQLNSWTTTIALEPRHGAAGTYASLLHTWSAINSQPEILKSLDNYATKIDMGKTMLGSSRWKPGEWLEARQELIRSGFRNVGGEMADLDAVFNNMSIVQGGSQFLKAGQKPFQWGEKAARIPAYYTAFRKFRDANPFGAITELDRQTILRDANILTNNMTRASNSVLNEGIVSLPMQFLSYTYRLGETFAGKEIGATTGERSLARLRLMAAYGAMYGIPSSVGVTGLPLGDTARKYAIDNVGYIPGEHWWSTAIMEGWPALFFNKASGGNNYDVGGKWGTKGMTTVSDLLRGDKTWIRIVGGAGVDNIWKFLSSFDGWYKAMISFARQDPADTRFKLTLDDMLKPAYNITAANSLRKTIVGVNTGKWISNNDEPVTDVSKANSVFMGVSGLGPLEQSDSWLKNDIVKEEKRMKNDALKSFLQDMQRADRAAKNNDPSNTEVFHRNGFSTLKQSGYSYEETLSAIAIAAENKGNSIKRSDYNFYLGDAIPENKRAVRKDAGIRQQKLNEEIGK